MTDLNDIRTLWIRQEGAGSAEGRKTAGEGFDEALRLAKRDAFDAGVSAAGRYGHEDSWDDETNPCNDNPWRTEDEKEF